ncbi:flagellar basal-body rod protein FlgG [Sansalvadorimonas sp. 2012CJ34-2]|uniref:Flagellar basal-body rod protein FlgG n=1 Tax=Parendozoicomonas callyspongiae TaxID=2942213 RepID=A0ABT0PDV6_9GAMM|nr:flagellar basal-body rod protein FlgG [Sansalvadorimonas sp. 2012CJ34-2]MCL6269553.1 flagellar basal-body rod protein FlgG [Sansalvadorimonas sp. 2012CJ34-2]
MHPALWINQTGLSVQDRQLMATANNLANVSTYAFKKDRAIVVDQFYREFRQAGAQADQQNTLPTGLQVGTGARVDGMQKVFINGNIQTTSQALDMSIVGQGFFQVQMPDGSLAYTRNGQFQLNSEGVIVMSDGLPLEPAITIPAEGLTVTIAEDGTVSVTLQGETQPQNVGQFSLVNFVNPTGLKPKGNHLYLETEASGNPVEGVAGENGLGIIRQFTLETSNVEAVEELVNLIMIQRSYEMNARAIETSDRMMEYLIRNV